MSFDSLLRHTVEVFRFDRTGETSDWAEPVTAAVSLGTIKARVQPNTGQEQLSATQDGPVVYTHRIFMRQTDLHSGDYILFDGDRYDVLAINDAGGSAHRANSSPDVTLDALAFEGHFLDHLAPVWHTLKDKGAFKVDTSLVTRAQAHGIEAEPISGMQLRRNPQRPPNPGPGPTALVASIGDIKVGRRLGYRRFAFLEHGIGQSYNGAAGVANRHPSYAGGADRADVGLFLVPNSTSAQEWRTYYPDARVAVVGSPKLDTLPGREFLSPAFDPVVAVSFHWNGAMLAPELRGTFQYYYAAVSALPKAFAVIGHGHPRCLGSMKNYYARAGIPVVEEFPDVMRQADVYACDNSSTLYEFASTGRPVVVLNAPWYRRTVEHGLRFWSAANVGVQCDDPADLSSAILRALMDDQPHQVAREAALDVAYAYRSGAAQRAAEELEQWLSA
jgi:hypothetical protein